MGRKGSALAAASLLLAGAACRTPPPLPRLSPDSWTTVGYVVWVDADARQAVVELLSSKAPRDLRIRGEDLRIGATLLPLPARFGSALVTQVDGPLPPPGAEVVSPRD